MYPRSNPASPLEGPAILTTGKLPELDEELPAAEEDDGADEEDDAAAEADDGAAEDVDEVFAGACAVFVPLEPQAARPTVHTIPLTAMAMLRTRVRCFNG